MEKARMKHFVFIMEDLADKLGCHEVAANSINLTPSLLKK
jgi:hypothetical protein